LATKSLFRRRLAHRAPEGDFFCYEQIPQADLFGFEQNPPRLPDEKVSGLLRAIMNVIFCGGILIAEKLLNEDKTGPIPPIAVPQCWSARRARGDLTEFRVLLESAASPKSAAILRVLSRCGFCRQAVNRAYSLNPPRSGVSIT